MWNDYVVPKDIPKTGLVLLLLNAHLNYGSFQKYAIRGEVFNKDFMKEHFNDVHRREFNADIEGGGYPDGGDGYYSRKLSYSDWFRLNSFNQRRMLDLGNLPLQNATVIASGMVSPNASVAVGVVYILARLLYNLFYKREKGQGKTARWISKWMCHFATMAGAGVFLWKCFKQ